MNSKKSIYIAIDAVNIRAGGGLTHLQHLLHAAVPDKSDVCKVTLWTCSKTASRLPQRDWLEVKTPSWCDGKFLQRIAGQQLFLPHEAKVAGCDVLFSPGGTIPWRCAMPIVTMSQNMLPFEPDRALLFGGLSLMRAKMTLLRFSQGESFKRAQGVIFLTNYAQQVITAKLKNLSAQTVCIPHGVEHRFRQEPRSQHIFYPKEKQPLYRLLYVSIQMPYKHQLEILEGVARLYQKGWPIELQLIGLPWKNYGARVSRKISELDPQGLFVRNLGYVNFEQLHELYRQADAFLFASSCENMPNILIEAMAAGLPILCSDRGPMPEILGKGGVYFDPENTDSIVNAIEMLLENPREREEKSWINYRKAQDYSWDRCAADTLNFITNVALNSS
jgi:glycosyltransferase involved in cell wall biosynthesis